MGEQLALENAVDADVIVPIPDSGFLRHWGFLRHQAFHLNLVLFEIITLGERL